MTTLDIEQKWADLEKNNQDPGYWRIRIIPDDICEFFLAVEKPSNRRVFLMEVKAWAIMPGMEFPKSKGFEVDLETIVPGHGGKVRIALIIRENRYKDIFTVLVHDIIRYVTAKLNQKEAVNEYVARLTRWQTFLKNSSPEGLGENEQTGLYGELWFIRHILLDNIGKGSLIKYWTGPQGTDQDFQFERSAVEVKSTTSGSHERLRISNVRQLDGVGIKTLILCHISLDARLGGVQSLPEIIKEVREILELKDPCETAKFNESLFEAGYLDIHEKLYCKRKYEVRRTHYFSVEGDFPRIIEKNLLPGVGDVNYSIELSACMPFEIDLMQVLKHVQGESAE